MLLHYTVPHLRCLDSSDPNPNCAPPAQAWLETTLPFTSQARPAIQVPQAHRDWRKEKSVILKVCCPHPYFPTHYGEVAALGIPAAALAPGHTLLLTEHVVAGLTNTALLARGGDFGVLTLALQIPAGR